MSLVWPTKFANTLNFLSKTDLMLENLWRMFENLNFGKTGFKTSIFEKHFISYSCILFIKFNALRSFCTKFAVFFKNVFFPEFRSIEDVFRSIEIAIKNLSEPLSISINRNWFSINWKSYEKFFKNWFSVESNTFSKSSLTFLSPYDSVKAQSQFFCRFPLIFLQGFPLSKPVSPFYPSFCIYFHVFMHFFYEFCWDFRTYSFWDLCWFKPYILKLIIGFCFYNVIYLILMV